MYRCHQGLNHNSTTWYYRYSAPFRAFVPSHCEILRSPCKDHPGSSCGQELAAFGSRCASSGNRLSTRSCSHTCWHLNFDLHPALELLSFFFTGRCGMLRAGLDLENPMPAGGGRSSAAAAAESTQWEHMALTRQDEDAYLRDLAGVEELETATSLRIVVNTHSTSVSHLGAKLPRLLELNLSGSVLESVRDLGTAFRLLQVLWVARCGLPGLEGLAALPALRELYASYNDIAELQPLDGCAELEVLDMEGNCVADLDALHALSMGCPKLLTLSLAGNPIAACPGYRSLATSLLPGLRCIDDEDLGPSSSSPLEQLGLEEGIRQPGSAVGGVRMAVQVGEVRAATASSSLSLSGGYSMHAAAATDLDELALVLSGIKHARVGVDSAEFRELEMTLLMAAELPSVEDAAASSRSSMLPVSASSWMRCSQQGSLPSQHRSGAGVLEREGSAPPSPRASSGGSGGIASRFAPPQQQGGAADRPSSSQGNAPLREGVLRRNSSGSGRPPPSARPFSARLGTASAGMRPPTSGGLGGAAGSAPPTAGGGGLYWRKNRLGAGTGAGGGGGGKLGPAADDNDDGDDGGSTLTFGVGGSGGAAIGGSLARDLRRRKRASALDPSALGPGGGSLLDAGGRRPGSGSSLGRGPVPGGSLGAAPLVTMTMSYDSASLLEELRRWKVETADRALMAAEDEGDGTSAWPDSASSSSALAQVADFGGRRPSDGSASLEEDELRTLGGGGAELLRLGSIRSDTSTEVELAAMNPVPGGGWPRPDSARSLSLSRPSSAVPGSPNQYGGNNSCSSKPPIARPLSSARSAAARAGDGALCSPLSAPRPSAMAEVVAGAALSLSPKSLHHLGHNLGPVQGPRPARTSKMTLCKVLGEATGRVIKTGGGGGVGDLLKGRPGAGGDSALAFPSSRDNPLFGATEEEGPRQQQGGEGGSGCGSISRDRSSLQRREPPVHRSLAGEVDIGTLNPVPLAHAQRNGDLSDTEE